MNLPKDIEDIPEIDIEFESKIIECKTKKLSDFGIYQVVKNQNIIMF